MSDRRCYKTGAILSTRLMTFRHTTRETINNRAEWAYCPGCRANHYWALLPHAYHDAGGGEQR